MEHSRSFEEKDGDSDEPLEPLFSGFADGADLRWLFAGAEIPAHLTPPDRE